MSNKWHDKARKDERGASTRPDARVWSAPWYYYEISSHPCYTRLSENQDYALQQQAAKLLHGKSRVCFCGKRKIDKLKNRSVVYNPNTERAYFENVQRCGSIWDCKVCAKKITETRRKELAFANELWKSGVVLQTFDYSEYPENFIGPIRPTWEYIKGHTYLITLTNSHNAGHSLLSQREGQKKAMKRFFEVVKLKLLWLD